MITIKNTNLINDSFIEGPIRPLPGYWEPIPFNFDSNDDGALAGMYK